MSEDDFTPVDESDLPYDIACAVLALRPVAHPLPVQKLVELWIESDPHGPGHNDRFARAVERAHGIGLE